MPPLSQSKDLEQQLQEELLEVVSELQTVRMGQGPPQSERGYHIAFHQARLKEDWVPFSLPWAQGSGASLAMGLPSSQV